MKEIFNLIIQLIIVLLVAPLFTGIIKKLKALIQHRKGAPVLQLYFDIYKLFKKDVVASETASWVFGATPYIYFITVLSAFIFVPVVPGLFSFGFAGDAIMIVYMLALGRFFMALSGLDTGSSFGGMGSSREMMISALVEPAFIVSIFTIGLNAKAGATSIQRIYDASVQQGFALINPVYILIFAAMLIIIIAETARIPVDDPATHLELTMVHEAMILEYSGRYLALIEYGSALKQLLLITIVVNVFMPFGASAVTAAGLLGAILLYVVKVLIVTVIIGLIEINTVKLRIFSVPNLAAIAFILSVIGFMSGFVIGR